jgi:predicted TIM-barrel fold metal-dependent hydrolase
VATSGYHAPSIHPWPVIDAHAHAFPDKVAATAIPKLTSTARWMPVQAVFDGTVAGLVATMDRAGVRRALLCSVATRPEQTPKITDWSAAVASDRIVPFASVHPDCPDLEAQVDRVAAAGLRGLKFHPQYMDCALDDPRTLRIAREAERVGLAMEFHTGYDLAYEKDELASPAALRRLHEAVPDLRLLACHLGGWQRWKEVLDEVAGLPIYLETSYTLGQCPPDLLEKILDRHPAEFLLFGTDAPWADPAAELAKFMALPLSDACKRAALWDNACRFAALD